MAPAEVAADRNGAPRLITLALSPYNDFARWALDRSGIPYDEQRKALIQHVFASRRARGKGTTPVLVTDDEVIADSSEIAEWADRHAVSPGALYGDGDRAEEVRGLVKHFGDDLGTETRPLFWTALIEDLDLANRLWSQGISERAARTQPWLLRLNKPVIKRTLNVRKDTIPTATAKIREIFDEAATRLRDRPHLVDDRISAADLSFAAMAAPALMPPEGHPTRYPSLDELSEPVADAMAELRQHPAGEYALRMYRDERGFAV
jgi:glutathione S-transferase